MMNEDETSPSLFLLYLFLPFMGLSIFFFSIAMYFQNDDIIVGIVGVLVLYIVVMIFVTVAFGATDKTKNKTRDKFYFGLLMALFIIFGSLLFGTMIYYIIIELDVSSLIILTLAIIFFTLLVFGSKIRDIVSKRKNNEN